MPKEVVTTSLAKALQCISVHDKGLTRTENALNC